MGIIVSTIKEMLLQKGVRELINDVVDFLERRDYSDVNIKILADELGRIRRNEDDIEMTIKSSVILIKSGSMDTYPELKRIVEITADDSFTECPLEEECNSEYLYIRGTVRDYRNNVDPVDRFIIELKKLLTSAGVQIYVSYLSDEGKIIIDI